uniref:SWIB domain-containing protein n=1 Tax=Steinernema glaseri TaxID=37863 RepID=A0A1I7ZXS0_9BILA
MVNDLPAAREEVAAEISALIKANGIDKLTPKNIRQHLAEKFNADFSQHRKTIDAITYDLIKEIQSKKASEEAKEASEAEESSDDSILDDAPKQSKPKKKRAADDEDTDDDLMSRVKRRRGASAPKKPRKTTKKPKDENAPKKRTAFTKICALSDELTEMLGRRHMTRSDVVSCMWSYFRDNDLLDPKDKRWVRCDAKLKDLCKKDKVLAFGVMKFLGPHITEAEYESEQERLRIEEEVDLFQKKRKAQKEKAGKAGSASTSGAAAEEAEVSSVASSSQEQADEENSSQTAEDAANSSSNSSSESDNVDSGDDDSKASNSGEESD